MARRRWKQQDIAFPARDGTRRGGKPGNRGRRPIGAPVREAHAPRPDVQARFPVHVTMRLVAGLASLRRARAYRAIRRATIVAARTHGATIVHLSIQSNHLHLLVEAADARQLGEGMRRFAISAAMQLNGAMSDEVGTKRRGRVFADRYHAASITNPTQARSALTYVLNNWRRHRADAAHGVGHWRFDPFSSAIHFRGWAELAGGRAWPIPDGYAPLVVGEPHSWLLRGGWLRGGGPIALATIPRALARRGQPPP